MYFEPYDIIVVGAGHAGCEAAAAAANMGSKVLLVTMDLRLMASMSCNPAMGGIAKGQIVREIDAMGGYSGIVSDRTMIQFRMLNKSKGPAMWSPRCQSDKMMFSAEWRSMLEKTQNLDFWQDTVTGLLVSGDKVKGVKTMMGGEIESKAVILTNGTFLNGLIHIGEQHFAGGRMGEVASHLSDESLTANGKTILPSVECHYVIAIGIERSQLDVLPHLQVLQQAVKSLSFRGTSDKVHTRLKACATTGEALQATSSLQALLEHSDIIAILGQDNAT